VDVSMGGLIVVIDGVHHLQGFLGGRGAIEIDERAVVHTTCQNRKITTQCFDIQCALTWERGHIGHITTLNVAWGGSI
jgi:hypothetical protein